ncbi:hypothetical protein [Bacillus sp. FJAT-47783]|uniref:hypothetical protein n=1 Tax=Bacillus sp. FJAT-47783 TaxID=2922712 RepID=UPI001FAC76FB|nr:hypothetical protein [Bacillus sp. FJAT-47783]
MGKYSVTLICLISINIGVVFLFTDLWVRFILFGIVILLDLLSAYRHDKNYGLATTFFFCGIIINLAFKVTSVD